jgi:hypothetical protein
MSKITKTMTLGEIEEILNYHQVHLGQWWHFVLWGLMQECDYIEVVGFGHLAKLRQINE